MGNNTRSNPIFHNKTTVISTGKVFESEIANTINIQFISTGTFSATFEAQCVDTNLWYPIMSANLKTLKLSNTVTDSSAIYQVDLVGIPFFRVSITQITGNISVFGKAVN